MDLLSKILNLLRLQRIDLKLIFGFILFIIFIILVSGLLVFSVDKFREESLEHVFFLITASFTLAGLTSLGGIVSNAKENRKLKLNFLNIGIIFLISGLSFVYFIAVAFYSFSGADINALLITIKATDFVRIGAYLYIFGIVVFVSGTFYFLKVLIDYRSEICRQLKIK